MRRVGLIDKGKGVCVCEWMPEGMGVEAIAVSVTGGGTLLVWCSYSVDAFFPKST